MKIVLKTGGTLLEDAAGRAHIADVVTHYLDAGNELLVVHGGGKQLTSYLDRTGVKSEFANGLRVTSAEALDGVVKVFAGTVNKNLVSTLVARGIPAVGISGIDGACLPAERLRGEHGEDFGYVGRIIGAEPKLWKALIAAKFLPVMACLAVGVGTGLGAEDAGQVYNVNADQAATACAAHWPADCLIFLTDVDGVRDSSGKVLGKLSAYQIPALLQSGAVSGGMLAKLRAVDEAVAAGVQQIVIRNGRVSASGVISESTGTVIESGGDPCGLRG